MTIMAKSRSRTRTLPVITFTFLVSIIFIVFPSLTAAFPIGTAVSQASWRRHDMHEDSDMDVDVVISSTSSLVVNENGDTHAATSTNFVEFATQTHSHLASSTQTLSTSPEPTHDHAHEQEHDHGSHAEAPTELNDTYIHSIHYFPPTYLDADFKLNKDSAIFGEDFDESWDEQDVQGHKTLMGLYVLGMGSAYFVILPIALALRSADHPAHHIVNTIFLVVAVLGWLAGVAYRSSSVDRYEGAVHWSFANALLLTSVSLAIIDSIGVIKRAISFYRQHEWSWSSFTHDVLRSRSTETTWPASRYEMVGLVEHEDDHDQVVFSIGDDEDEHDQESPRRTLSRDGKPRRPSLLIRQWTPPSRTSTGSEGTLQDTDTPSTSASTHAFGKKHHRSGAYNVDKHAHFQHEQDTEEEQPSWKKHKSKGLKRAVEICLTWIRRAQVIFAYVVFLTGITMYTGMCRAGLINSCAAHYIKGSVFFLYGLLTFGRYLGAYAELGWAWNRRPGGNGISAEMLECAVIFTYGITNTWMERFGSGPDAPYTVKQVQHISIAVMFWFAGLSGMLLESRRVRQLLGSVVSAGRRDVQQPLSCKFSFNPLPALVIGVTGLAMAAHHQEYVFQVQIHSLWGILLAGGSLFRFLTYFFLFLKPPVDSELPSRPPTEILTSFGYAAGGIVFMLSNEEIAWAAMRAGWDDMMAFMNFTVALVCLIFCWSVVVMAIKGWAVIRINRERAEEEQA